MESRESQIRMDIGRRLRFLRNAEGCTQETVAAVFGCSENHISRLENGERGPSLEILLKASKYYKVSIDWILTGSNVPDDFSKQLIRIAKELVMLAEGHGNMNEENDDS